MRSTSDTSDESSRQPESPDCAEVHRALLAEAVRSERDAPAIESVALARIVRHVSACAACSEILLGRDADGVRVSEALAARSVASPTEVEWERVANALAREPFVRVTAARRTRRTALWAAAAAVALVAVTLGLLRPAREASPSTVAPEAIALDVDILECPAESVPVVFGRETPNDAVLVWFMSS